MTQTESSSAGSGPHTGMSPGSKPLKLGLLVVMVLLLGVIGRARVSGGVSNSFIADLLPWLKGTPVTIYFMDETRTRLVPLSLTLTGEEQSAMGLMNMALKGPAEDLGLVSPFPEATEVLSATLDEPTISVDLSAGYLYRESPLSDEALIQTLASWPGVEQVWVTVEGIPLQTGPRSGHLLFFYDQARDLLIAQPTDAGNARDVLAAYLAGPQDPGLTGVPPDVEIIDFHASPGSGLLQINMTYSPSLRQLAFEDGDAMRRILEGMMVTLTTGFPETEFLYVDFDGHASLGLGQCADLLRRVQPPPRVLNDERLLAASRGT